MRKIIQIQTCGVDNTSSTQCSFIRTALCDDGTVWESYDYKEWCLVVNVPQEAKEPTL